MISYILKKSINFKSEIRWLPVVYKITHQKTVKVFWTNIIAEFNFGLFPSLLISLFPWLAGSSLLN